jgi:hypothetical protein
MNNGCRPDLETYGVHFSDEPADDVADLAEQVRRIGYATIESGFSATDLAQISDAVERTRTDYLGRYGVQYLREISELHIVRAPLFDGGPLFLKVATNTRLLRVISQLIRGEFILNQQNVVINPVGDHNVQRKWHRDLPHQHLVTSSPIAVNALFCIDDFTEENGATLVLPATHLKVNFPSAAYVDRNIKQLHAKRGQYILLDSMLYHCAGPNMSGFERRAINQIYAIPYIKQQINISKNIVSNNLTQEEKRLLGFFCNENETVENYIGERFKKFGGGR